MSVQSTLERMDLDTSFSEAKRKAEDRGEAVAIIITLASDGRFTIWSAGGVRGERWYPAALKAIGATCNRLAAMDDPQGRA